MRVTDLEDFALRQIFWPYWDSEALKPFHEYHSGGGLKRPDSLPMPLDEIPEFAKKHYGVWWILVRGRLFQIGFTFPPYIKHPLVDFIRTTTFSG